MSINSLEYNLLLALAISEYVGGRAVPKYLLSNTIALVYSFSLISDFQMTDKYSKLIKIQSYLESYRSRCNTKQD